MATVIHDNFRNAQFGVPANSTTTVDFDGDDVRVSLLDQTDSGTITASTENYGTVDTATVVADSGALGSKTVGVVSVGTFDFADVTFGTITGDAADFLTMYQFNATPANATLIATWDSTTTGLPVTPNGGDITVPPPDTWSQLRATLENLPGVTDTRTVWIKYAKQLTGLMVLAGLWEETDGDKLTGLDKKALVEKITDAHKKATKKAGDHAPF